LRSGTRPAPTFVQLDLELGPESGPSRPEAVAVRKHTAPPASERAGAPQAGPLQKPRRGAFDAAFLQLLLATRAAGDSQRRRVYAWQRETLGELQHEALLGEGPGRRITQRGARRAALAYLAHLWSTYAQSYAPYYCDVPYLRIGFATGLARPRRRTRLRYGAYAVPLRHAIYCRLASLRRSTLVHEVCHLLVWREGHGPRFCAALIALWELEFGIERSRSLASAARHGVTVDSSSRPA
jgi:hypothetical protein